MFCGECGARNPDTNQFCKNCGKPLARRQPAAQPAAQPAYPAAPLPSAAPGIPSSPAAASVPGAAPKLRRNWLGIGSLILGLLSWIVMTLVFAVVAILLGIAGLYLFRRSTGRIGISGIIGMVLGIAAIAVTIALA
jgi:hypothetical protein